MIKVCGMREPNNIRDVAALGIDLMGFIFYPKSPRYVQMISSMAGIIPDYSRERLHQAVQHGAPSPAAESEPSSSESGSPSSELASPSHRVQRVGVFVDDMPQNIVTRVYNYDLDYVQLHGSESPEMIDNLRRTLVPDIAPNIKIIKALSIHSREDVARYKPYEGLVDLFLFDTKCPQKGGSGEQPDGSGQQYGGTGQQYGGTGQQYGGTGEQFDWSVLDAYDGQTPFLLSGGIGPDDAERVLAFHHPRFAGIDLNSRFETAPALKDVALLRAFLSRLRAQ